MSVLQEIWLLVDDKAGHKNQVLGVGNALNIPYNIKNIKYNGLGGLPNFLKSSSLLGIDAKKSDPILPPWPDIVIAAGRRTAPVARYIKKQATEAGKKCFTVQIMWPGFPAKGFDLIAVPEHDKIKPAKNIIKTIGAPHPITAEKLASEAAIWEKTLASPPKPCFALMIGGNAGKKKFTAKLARELGRTVSTLVNDLKGSLLVTTSRRTPKEVVQALKSSLICGNYFHEWGDKNANPYFAFMGLGDVIIVTGDSISMCSEACAAGKPVYIYAPDGLVPEKHKRMHESLYSRGFAQPFGEKEVRVIKNYIKNYIPSSPAPLDTARIIAEEIRKRAL